MNLRVLLGICFVLSLPEPARASTIPPVNLNQSEVAITAGIYDLGVDFGLTDHLSFGVSSVAPFDSHGLLAFRVLYLPLGVQRNLNFGLMASFGTAPSAGFFRPYNGDDATFPVTHTGWFQPALGFIASLYPLPVSIRATVGPVFPEPQVPPYLPSFLKYAWPNVEVAYRFNEFNELTLGGNAIVGWRWRTGFLSKLR